MERFEELLAPCGRLSPQQLDLLVRQIATLATPAAVVAELAAAQKPECFVAVAECDPAVTARLLQLAGGQGRPARSVAAAVEALGADAARAAALALPLQEPRNEGETPRMHLRELRRHCIAVGIAAGMIAERAHLPVAPGEALACGLLHDLGKLALLTALPKSYARVLEGVQAGRGNIADCERNILGVDHCVAGRRLAEHWRLGATIQQVAWMHHQPPEAIPPTLEHRRLATAVQLADTLTRRMQVGFSGNYTFPHSPAEQAAPLQLTPADLEDIEQRLAREVDRRCALLGLDRDEDDALTRRALREAKAELGELNARLAGRAAQIDRQARAFAQLQRFTDGLSDRSTVIDVLEQVAQLAAEANQAGGPVVVYSIDTEHGELLVLQAAPDQPLCWRTLPCREDFDAQTDPPDGANAALDALTWARDELAAWIDPATCAHQPLCCSGRWVGGVFCPPADDEALHPVASAVALALATVQGRCQAIALGEQLAGASQMLDETGDALADARTLTALGELAAGAAHEMNTPLAIISGRAQLMGEQADDQTQRNVWQLIAEQTQRISDIVSELMAFASPPPPKPAAFDVVGMLHEAKNIVAGMEQLQSPPIQVDIELAERLPKAWADPQQMRSAVVELLTNAATASPGGEPIRLTARRDEDGVLISVADRGLGMDERTLAQAFTPFYSQQKAGRRRGLALPRARRQVEANGGRLWIRSAVGQGTTAYLHLPVKS